MIKLYLISLLLINFIFSDVKYINSVSVEGNFAIDKNQILKIINTKNPKFLFEDIFNSRKLHLDKISIKNFYRSLGYLEADVDYEVEEINNKKNDSKLPVVILDKNLFFQNSINTTIEIFIPAPNTLKKIRKIDVFVGGSSNNSCNVPCIFIDYETSLNILNKSESFYEVLLKNPFNSDITIKEILSIKPELQGKIIDWKSLNSNLFNIMKLERFSLGIFLFFLILISSTTLYSNTVSMIFQKKSDIATLISLGATNKQVVLVFLITNLLIALCGYLLGVILVVLTTYLLINTNLIEILNINLTFYGIEGFPIIFSLEYFFYISFFSLLIIIFATYLPTKNYLGKNIRNLINRNN